MIALCPFQKMNLYLIQLSLLGLMVRWALKFFQPRPIILFFCANNPHWEWLTYTTSTAKNYKVSILENNSMHPLTWALWLRVPIFCAAIRAGWRRWFCRNNEGFRTVETHVAEILKGISKPIQNLHHMHNLHLTPAPPQYPFHVHQAGHIGTSNELCPIV